MTEDEVLEQINGIGQAFADDFHDGDGPVMYEGFTVGDTYLRYEATLEDGREVHAFFRLDLVSLEEVGDGK